MAARVGGMFGSWTIGQKVAGGFALPLFILMLLGTFTYRSTQQLMQTSYWVAHTHDVLTNLAETLSAMQDVETGQRGFAATGKENFLEPYQAGLGSVTKHLERVKTLTSDNPRQQERVERLREQIRESNAYSALVVDTRKNEGLERASALLSEGRGKLLMDAVRQTVADMRAEENELLARRAREAEVASRNLTWVLVGGTVAALALVFTIAMVIVRGLGQQIGGTVQRMRGAAAELEAASTQQAKGAQMQASTAAEVSTTARQLVSTARQIAESAQQVTQMANETAESARRGDKTVSAAHEGVLAVRDEVNKIVARMVDLGRKSQEIGGIVDIINELSEQTNILAINATIESVGAGEAGRRFGVVAGEIRKLADRVSGSTRDIRRLIEEIRSASNTTIIATEDGAKAVEAGTRKFEEVTESFERIADFAASTAEAARHIELSTKQQTTAMEQVSSAVADVAQTARETEASSSQTLQTASELSTLSAALAQLVRRRDVPLST